MLTVGCLFRDDTADVDCGKVPELSLHAVVHYQPGLVLYVQFYADIIVLVLCAVYEHGAGTALRDGDIVVNDEIGAILRHAQLFGAYPLRPAPSLGHQSGVEPAGLALGLLSQLIDDLDLPPVAAAGLQCRPFIPDVQRLV